MRRELKAGDQCEHLISTYPKRIRCEVRHHSREPGEPPQQLVPVKDGKLVRFMCLEHAPKYQRGMTVRRQRKSQPPEEQVILL